MPVILAAGSGQIGSAIRQILSQPNTEYSVVLADLAERPPQHLLLHDRLNYVRLDVRNKQHLKS